MKKAYISLDTENLPEGPKKASLGNMVVLHDSFEHPIRWEHAETTDYMNAPIKLASTMTLFFCLEGEVEMQCEGRSYFIRKNDVSFNKGGLFGEVKHISRDLQFALVAMNEDFYCPILNKFDQAIMQRILIKTSICSLSQECVNECVTLYKLLKERIKHHGKDALQKDIVRSYLQTLTFNVYSQFKMSMNQPYEAEKQLNRQQDVFNQFMELLQKYYITERKISFYADQLNITPRYLSRIINEVSGHFASDQIDFFVIAEAKQLLRSKEYTVLQVSEMLNFTSQSLFGRYFKKFTGYTPKEYQNLK